MLVDFLKRIYKKLNTDVVHGVQQKVMPLDEQKKFLASFPEPKDVYERSFYKFQCFCEYCYYKKKWMLILYNLGAMVLCPFVFAVFKKRGAKQVKSEVSYDAVVENVPRLRNEDVIPEELAASFNTVKEIEELDYMSGYLTPKAAEICKNLRKRYFWQFYFRTIVMIKLALFSRYLYEYNPKKIAFYSVEREFSGPLQTLLCEQEGAEYICFMHGDYLYSLAFAFQKYSHYYIWDDVYNRMFLDLKCDCPMTVYQPKKLSGIAKKLDEHECSYFATYYFSAETREQALKIKEAFLVFEKRGLRCKIRPHPRFSDIAMLSEVFAETEIEDPKNYSLADSITDSVYTVGLNTTVLSQAYFSGKKVAIDDVSAPSEYQELKDRQYIMLNRPHELLSDIVGELADSCPYDESYCFVQNDYVRSSFEQG